MHLEAGGKWVYDPHDVIYNIRTDSGREYHKHVSNPVLEKLANKSTWEELRIALLEEDAPAVRHQKTKARGLGRKGRQ